MFYTLITGASMGIGEAFARELASRGRNLILVARSAERLRALAEEFRQKRSVAVEVCVEDLSDAESLGRIYEFCRLKRVDVDFLINCAGLSCEARPALPRNPVHVMLDNLRSAYNVGSMFRTADAAGIEKIYLTGYTPAPLDRFGRKRKDLAKSALGAEEFVVWEERKNIFSLLTKLKREKFLIIGVEQDKKSIDYKKVKTKSKNVFIVGAEVAGIPKNILEKCNIIAEIPMRGRKESLNVSVACGIVLFRFLDF